MLSHLYYYIYKKDNHYNAEAGNLFKNILVLESINVWDFALA